MDIKAKLVKAFDTGKIKATFDVTLDDKFVIHGVKLIRGDKGDFVSMPSDSWKNKKGEIHHSDMAHPLDAETRSALRISPAFSTGRGFSLESDFSSR